jgi:putative ABC transport system permease protein
VIVIAAQTLRTRWRLSVGTFIALAFGVALAASAGLLVDNPALPPEFGALFASMASIACFIAIFVVAGTYAFSVDQRRRELALLRAVGATPRQIKQLIVGETLLVGAAASAIGCVLAVPASWLLVRQLVGSGLLPDGAAPALSAGALAVAFVIGLVVARLAVLPASRRARRARPVEALRDAVVERRVMTPGRWINGILFLAGGIAMLTFIPTASIDAALSMSITVAEVLVVALSALAPLFVPPLARLAGLPLTHFTNASGYLAVASIRTGVRRCASTAAPVLATVAIFGSMAGLTSTAVASDEADNRASVTASLVVDPVGAGPVRVDPIRDIPGVRAVVPIATSELAVVVDEGVGEDHEVYDDGPYDVAAVDPALLTGIARVRVRDGDLGRIRGTDIAVTSIAASELGLRVGRTVTVKLAGGGPVDVRIVAVVEVPSAIVAEFLVPPEAGAGWPVGRVFVTADPAVGAASPVAGPGLAAAVQAAVGSTGRAESTADWITRTRREAERDSWLAVLLLLGMAMVYTVIAIANTQLMAAGERAGDIARLRRIGATPAQTIRMVIWETCACVGVGVVLGTATAMISLAAVWRCLRTVNPSATLAVPWWTLAGVIGVCAVVAVVAAVLPVLRTART